MILNIRKQFINRFLMIDSFTTDCSWELVFRHSKYSNNFKLKIFQALVHFSAYLIFFYLSMRQTLFWTSLWQTYFSVCLGYLISPEA